jgi:hypothetical protein
MRDLSCATPQTRFNRIFSMSSVIARPTTRSKQEVSMSFFSFLFSEMVTLANASSADVHLEEQLHRMGFQVGERSLSLFHLRERPFRRETSATSCLQFIANSVWKQLFGRPAELQSTDQTGEYYLVDKGMLLNRFISISPEAAKDNTMINCACFAAGIVEGMMRIAGFRSTKVEAAYTLAGSIDVMNEPQNVTFVVHLVDKR